MAAIDSRRLAEVFLKKKKKFNKIKAKKTKKKSGAQRGDEDGRVGPSWKITGVKEAGEAFIWRG